MFEISNPWAAALALAAAVGQIGEQLSIASESDLLEPEIMDSLATAVAEAQISLQHLSLKLGVNLGSATAIFSSKLLG